MIAFLNIPGWIQMPQCIFFSLLVPERMKYVHCDQQDLISPFYILNMIYYFIVSQFVSTYVHVIFPYFIATVPFIYSDPFISVSDVSAACI